jgi:hypothetical protein
MVNRALELITAGKRRLKQQRRVNLLFSLILPIFLLFLCLYLSYHNKIFKPFDYPLFGFVSLVFFLFLEQTKNLTKLVEAKDAAHVLDQLTDGRDRFLALATLQPGDKEDINYDSIQLIALQADNLVASKQLSSDELARLPEKIFPFSLERTARISLMGSGFLLIATLTLVFVATDEPLHNSLHSPVATEMKAQIEDLRALAKDEPNLPAELRQELNEVADILEERGIEDQQSIIALDQTLETIDSLESSEIELNLVNQSHNIQAEQNEKQAPEKDQPAQDAKPNQGIKQEESKQDDSKQQNPAEQQAEAEQETKAGQKTEADQKDQMPTTAEQKSDSNPSPGDSGKENDAIGDNKQSPKITGQQKQDEKKDTTGLGENQNPRSGKLSEKENNQNQDGQGSSQSVAQSNNQQDQEGSSPQKSSQNSGQSGQPVKNQQQSDSSGGSNSSQGASEQNGKNSSDDPASGKKSGKEQAIEKAKQQLEDIKDSANKSKAQQENQQGNKQEGQKGSQGEKQPNEGQSEQKGGEDSKQQSEQGGKQENNQGNQQGSKQGNKQEGKQGGKQEDKQGGNQGGEQQENRQAGAEGSPDPKQPGANPDPNAQKTGKDGKPQAQGQDGEHQAGAKAADPSDSKEAGQEGKKGGAGGEAKSTEKASMRPSESEFAPRFGPYEGGSEGKIENGEGTAEKVQVGIDDPLEEHLSIRTLGGEDQKIYRNKPGARSKTALGSAEFKKPEADVSSSSQPIPVEYLGVFR